MGIHSLIKTSIFIIRNKELDEQVATMFKDNLTSN